VPGRTTITRVAIDLETTGLHADQDAIIEIGALKFAGEDVLDTFESFVSPGIPVPFRVQRLTGIGSAQLKHAPSLAELLPKLRAFIGDFPLVGHSVPFDAAFLHRVGLARHNPLVDTFELASALLPGLPSYTLASVGRALGVKSPMYHRALADAQLSMEVFLALLKRLDELDASTIEGLGRLAAPPDWTPAYFVRAAVREQRASLGNLNKNGNGGLFAGATSSLGDQLAAKLGMDPAVLSLAITPETPPARMRLVPLDEDAPTPEDTAAEVAATEMTATTEATETPETLPPMAVVAPEIQAEAQAMLQRTISVNAGAALATGGGPLLLEAQNDGSGAIACLSAALTWASEHQSKLLVSAADQERLRRLVQRLLPRAFELAALSPDALSVMELAERESYLCLHRWFGIARTARNGTLSQDMARGLAKLTVWAGRTETGARGEVALAGSELGAWERVRSGTEFADSASDCTYRRDGYCFVARAQEAAVAASVVLTTHAALAAHLSGADTFLPEADRVLVLDAHLLEDELRRSRSSALDQAELTAQLDQLAETLPDGKRAGLLHLAAQRMEQSAAKGRATHEKAWFAQVERARRSSAPFFQAWYRLLVEALGDSGKGGQLSENIEQRVLRLDAASRRLAAWDEVASAWVTLDEQLTGVAKLAREVGQQVVTLRGKKASIASDGIATDLFGAARMLDRIRAQVSAVFSASGAENAVYWLRLPYSQNNNNNVAGDGNAGRRGRFDHRQQQKPRDAKEQPPAQAAGATESADTMQTMPETQEVTPPSTPAETPETTESAAASPAASATLVATLSATEPEATPVLHSAPIRVGQELASLATPERGLILAAPALAVAGDFTFATGSLNLPATTQTLGPAMDRSQQTLLCLPSDVPEPNAPKYQRHLDDLLIHLATTLNGDLVVMFPSHAALRSSAVTIRRVLERQRIMLMVQGQDGSVRQLWRAFRTESRVVLLGAGAFWEGMDQIERPPACVVVTRVPFPALSDPLLAARAETWEDQQSQFVVPHAALKLRQALGGLAWSHWRRNAVVLFDRRLQTRGYGQTILGTLPRCTHYQEPAAQIVERAADWVAGNY
jgi:DNA polymerase III epsilon subunit family exonuclease